MKHADTAKIRAAAKVLREHNVWRRGGDEQSEGVMQDPQLIGEAIDTLCAFAEKQTRSCVMKAPKLTKAQKALSPVPVVPWRDYGRSRIG